VRTRVHTDGLVASIVLVALAAFLLGFVIGHAT
jgi:VIT1/CCC1 family predicted Fe2+/Mn2+ transporter